jgi:hypothetical protein
VLSARAARRGLDLVVDVCPWPDAGSVQKIGRRLVVTVDSRQSKSDQLFALAHEAGHVLLGHYALDDGIWTMREQKAPGDDFEAEADFFAMFVCRSRCLPASWYLNLQLDLLRSNGI